jgi:hypothetical protein
MLLLPLVSGSLNRTLKFLLVSGLAAVVPVVGDIQNDEESEDNEHQDATDNNQDRVIAQLEFEWHLVRF